MQCNMATHYKKGRYSPTYTVKLSETGSGLPNSQVLRKRSYAKTCVFRRFHILNEIEAVFPRRLKVVPQINQDHVILTVDDCNHSAQTHLDTTYTNVPSLHDMLLYRPTGRELLGVPREMGVAFLKYGFSSVASYTSLHSSGTDG